MSKHQLPSWLPQLGSQVWILAFGRFLSHTGTGFTLFYAPIFFVNQLGLSATAVGLGLGSAQVSGILGRILGGSLSDSPVWGRRRTLLMSAIISAVASFMLATAKDFTGLVLGNVLMGLGVGLYWPATEAAIADLTEGEERREAFALTRLADNLGLQVGIILGGLLITLTGAYWALFVIDGISFLIFFVLVYFTISETYKPKISALPAGTDKIQNGWKIALQDRSLLVYVLVNILFTLYISQTQSTIPLYLSNFIPAAASGKGFSPGTLTALFTWHTILLVSCQLPIARAFKRFSHTRSLVISALLWGIGFILIGMTGIAHSGNIFFAILGLGILSIAIVSYTPAASSIVADLAPESLRGVYLSINSQCWAIGYLIGPPLGGWALDQGKLIGDNFWLGIALSVGVAILILQQLEQMLKK
ncbi:MULTISPECIES: MDR family MFS transporter [Kamptonema]|uniref:MDR family MFS transporter n=1 Tax=Kamptonema TaxID=1501433 RepID=UPI0001DAC741|nr:MULTISPECIES: MFS transporter [Kamptonema]CBN58001.1 major facilitator transporter [Kamptonema sp. PCC 6506]